MNPYALSFDRPVFLAFALLLPLLYLSWRFTLVGLPRGQQRLSLALRTFICALLIAALAGFTASLPTAERYLVLAIDHSASVDDQQRSGVLALRQLLQKELGTDHVLEVHFDRQAELVSKPSDSLPPSPTADGLGTNIQAGLDLSVALVPQAAAAQIVLVSDGNETDGDAMQAALRSRWPIYTVPTPESSAPEVQLTAVHAPAHVAQGQPFRIEVEIRARQAGDAQLRIFQDDTRVDIGDRAAIRLHPGINRFPLEQVIFDRKQTLFTAQVVPAMDTRLDNNQASAVVVSSGKPAVLLIDDQAETVESLRWALTEQEIRTEVRQVAGLPARLADLAPFDAVVLSNVPATGLSSDQQRALDQFVADLGGGLIVLGGDQAYGLGGYYGSDLERMLPVRSDFEKDREKPTLAMILILDRSGSMGGIKLELAKDAARAAVELLGPRDQVGVIAFDDVSYWVSELRSAADKQQLLERINTVSPGGGTNMYPALVDALQALASTVAKLKHVLVLTDGISASSDYRDITADLTAERITVSTVAIGEGADQDLLRQIAAQGGGRYYYCPDPYSVPQVFAKETMTAGKSALNEEPVLPVPIGRMSALRAIDLAAAPPLLGYVTTRPKGTATVALATDQGDPLLAWWRYGLGTAVAFTSDVQGRWSAEWLAWPDFSAFWAQLVRFVAPHRATRGGSLTVEAADRQGRLVLDLVDERQRFVMDARTVATVLTPDGEQYKLQLQQTLPGRYEAEFPCMVAGPYSIGVRATRDRQLLFQQVVGWHSGYPEELQLRAVDEPLLRRIADVSGGAYDLSGNEILQAPVPTAFRRVPLWPYLLALSLLLFTMDVAVRRIVWSADGPSGSQSANPLDDSWDVEEHSRRSRSDRIPA